MFNYGGIRKFFIKLFLGLFFLLVSIFSIVSFLTYSVDDPGLFSSNSPKPIINYFGVYGAYYSSVLQIFLNKTA